MGIGGRSMASVVDASMRKMHLLYITNRVEAIDLKDKQRWFLHSKVKLKRDQHNQFFGQLDMLAYVRNSKQVFYGRYRTSK